MLRSRKRIRIPVALARRVSGRTSDTLQLIACPFGCKSKTAHAHGAGYRSAFGSFDGPRAAHCVTGPGVGQEYFVKEISSEDAAA